MYVPFFGSPSSSTFLAVFETLLSLQVFKNVDEWGDHYRGVFEGLHGSQDGQKGEIRLPADRVGQTRVQTPGNEPAAGTR